MRLRTHFGRAIEHAIMVNATTQARISIAAKLSQGALNHIIQAYRRPDADTLRALCNCWPDRITCARILIEHLRDEVERAGHADGTIHLSLAGDNREAAAQHALAIIHQRSREVAQHLDALIEDLARLVASDPETASELLAAEPDPDTPAPKPVAPRKATTYKIPRGTRTTRGPQKEQS